MSASMSATASGFDDVALVDGHAHPPLVTTRGMPFARFFSEAGDEEFLDRHARETLFYRRALRELAGLLDCSPDEHAVLAARGALGPEEFLRLLVRDANVGAILVDDGYPPQGAISVRELAGASGCACYRLLRIESLAQALVPVSSSAGDLRGRLLDAFERQPAAVGLKTVIAYRSGLAVAEPPPSEVERCFAEVRAACDERPPRLTAKPLLDDLLLAALDWAAERGLPVQFHTGYGDRDIDLPLANPALLRPVLEQPRFRKLTVVLLHASYPYTREASYLAAVYPRVFVDWSEVNPMLSVRQLARVLEELLALAPFTKLLYGSDAWGIPDWLWLGARSGRAALAAALEDAPDRQFIGQRILRENAVELYRLAK